MSVEIGSYLRQAREAIGLSLDQLQEKTKIQKSFLIAIENGEFDKLPSPFYVRTYLRSYANCVKVEPHHILRHYRKIEQAERFTGVHKAVSEKDLSQTQTFQFPPLQQTGKIPVVSPGTGPQSVVSQETLLRKPLNQKPAQRIDTKTALTAPKTETSGLNDSARRNRELARRD
ncbi:MAG: helix-turn-helix domain-containing protein, partial [Thermoactinomyces sp.]